MTVAAAIAAYGLSTEHELPPEPRPPAAFTSLLADCEMQRLLGLLAQAVRDRAMPVTREQRDRLERMFLAWLGHSLRAERLLLDATSVLDRAGIESRVMKGAALAHTVYDDPAQRVFGDVDVLVPTGKLTQAVAVLEQALSARRVQPELRPGFDDRFGKEAMVRVNGLELDVHRVFVEGALGLTIRVDDLFAPPYRFPLGATELEALPMPPRLLNACYAAALGDWPPRLISLRDVAQLVLRERPHPIDVLLMAREWQCEAVVARALTTAWESLALLDVPPLVEWARRYAPTRTDRMLLRAHEGPARAFTRHLAALVVLPKVRDRAAYLHAIVLPQRAYLEARGFTAVGNVRRAMRRIFG